MQKTYFLSDLHLFANRSQAERYLALIRAKAADAAAFVLGGDTFDFRWSIGQSSDRTAEDAMGWLDRLASPCRECRFHLLLGNHDYRRVFIDRLMRCEDEIPNLSWHRYYVRLGDSVFLHGDVVDRPMGAEGLARARSRLLHETAKSARLDRLYDLVVRANLHRPIARLRRRKKTSARRILSYLEDIGQGPSNGVRNVYFGHTHRAFSDYEYGGMIFHNSGAPMKGLEFRILEVST